MIPGDSGQEGTPAHLQSLTSGHLRIVNLSYTDQGLYTCKAVNIHGTVQSSTELTVLGISLISYLIDFLLSNILLLLL